MAKIGKIIGMDISKTTFDVAYRSGDSVKTRKWEYTEGQMEEFGKTLDRECVVVMEATGVYHTRLAAYLHTKGIGVSVVNPLSAKNFARMLMRRTKTDKADSKLLLEYGETMELEMCSRSGAAGRNSVSTPASLRLTNAMPSSAS